jgi:IS5 family transposase
MELTHRCGEEVIKTLSRALLEQSVTKKAVRSRRLRVDTTAVEADVRYPTDPGLRVHAISRIWRLLDKIKAAGLATRPRFRDRRRRAGTFALAVRIQYGEWYGDS